MIVKKSFSENEVNEVKKWDLFFVDDFIVFWENELINVLNKCLDWKYELFEVEEEIKLFIVEEIEVIC